MKFLIIRFSSIGDIVLTTPVVRCLKKQIPEGQIHYTTKYTFRSLIESNPYIDKVHYYNNDLDALIEELKQENFDYIIDLHHNLRTLKVKRALGKKAFSFNKLNIEKWIYTNFKWNVMPDVHIVDRYLDTLKSFGVKNDGEGLDYFIPEKHKVKETDIPASHHAGYIGVVIGAALNTKKMPMEKLQHICRLIDHPIILLGGKEDAENGKLIAANDPVKIYNACGKFAINESADLVRRAKLIITHDTGLMHIAAAFRKKIISIWGNTVPAFGMSAYFGNTIPSDIQFGVAPLYCRPCSKIGYKKCPHDHFKCMRKQDEIQIAEKAKQQLGK
ncbi:MAG: glycosyltransferase family 9 protein [Chitinophagaceae bacterium]|nr:glycosyltransferase family 9 protein [Chitinophagaceae bacterium]